MSRLPDDLFFDLVRADEIGTAHELEAAGYPLDEAASLDALNLSPQSSHPHRVHCVNALPVADAHAPFNGGTRTRAEALVVCIHSVCVASTYHRRGIALKLLQEYLERMEKILDVARVLLICKAPLKPLYTRAGFEEVGPSAVVHGQDPWFEMRKDFNRDQPPQATILAALQSQSTRPKSGQRAYASFEDPFINLTYEDQSVRYNTFKLTCPRSQCGSLILLRGVGVWTPAQRTTIYPEIFDSPNPTFQFHYRKSQQAGGSSSLPDAVREYWVFTRCGRRWRNQVSELRRMRLGAAWMVC
ncbi:Acetyltransferase (GNAT) domain [Rhizoctonia solani]|uniref:Acetyltransferase (GNAT) domain n=1 Tax=Rhizoctonia solani TaxID=456999 RepID=A0A8H7IAC6_9AGAM|nr:Acetyltransferase (GNAT) domain [Rhizoctonia solani]